MLWALYVKSIFALSSLTNICSRLASTVTSRFRSCDWSLFRRATKSCSNFVTQRDYTSQKVSDWMAYTQKLIFSKFWEWELWDQIVGRVVEEKFIAASLDFYQGIFSLYWFLCLLICVQIFFVVINCLSKDPLSRYNYILGISISTHEFGWDWVFGGGNKI